MSPKGSAYDHKRIAFSGKQTQDTFLEHALNRSGYYTESHPFVISAQLPGFAREINALNKAIYKEKDCVLINVGDCQELVPVARLLEIFANLPASQSLSEMMSAHYRVRKDVNGSSYSRADFCPIHKLRGELYRIQLMIKDGSKFIRATQRDFQSVEGEHELKERVDKLKKTEERLRKGFKELTKTLLERMPKDPACLPGGSIHSKETSEVYEKFDRFMGFTEGTWDKEVQAELAWDASRPNFEEHSDSCADEELRPHRFKGWRSYKKGKFKRSINK